jgi:hypothetical protein
MKYMDERMRNYAEDLKEHLEEACHAALRLTQLGFMDYGIYEKEFNSKIAEMERLLREIRGDE